MNSIELVNNPEKKAPQQANDGPVLRVFTKEGNTYTLQHETKDYQQAIRQAEKFYDKGGKDILVNEKDNPNIVHAKTNRNKDVDVGREIRPHETQGIPIRGTGEVVLASFYVKLPMDTKAFDEREARKAPGAPQAGEPAKGKDAPEQARDGGKEQNERIAAQGAKELAAAAGVSLRADFADNHLDAINERKQAKGMEDEAYKKLALVGLVRAEALVAAEWAQYSNDGQMQISNKFDPVKFQAAISKGERDPAKQMHSEATAGEPTKAMIAPEAPKVGAGPKAVLDKTGYELPEKLLGAYTVQDGKFHDKDTKALRFEDHGKKLSTPVEDRKVIGDMIEVATAKNWNQLELKGTETFKQIAWLEAQARGIETKGYKPNERDLEQLDKLHQERGANEKQMSGPAAPDVKPAREQNEIMAVAPRTLSPDEKMHLDVATKVMEKSLAKVPEHIRADAIAKMVRAVEKGDLKLPTPKVTERAIDKPRPAPAPAMDRGR